MNAIDRPPRATPPRHRGFTLLEVILALAVLAVGLAVIGEANNTADRNARRAALEGEAAVVAEAVMAELAAGARELVSTDSAPWDEGEEIARWSFRVAIEPAPVAGLLAARVTAYETRPIGQAEVRVSLVRWLVDPAALPVDDAPISDAPTSDAPNSDGGLP